MFITPGQFTSLNQSIHPYSTIHDQSPHIWTGRRLTTKGYRWAPATFLGQVDISAIFQDLDIISDAENYTERTTQGLVVQSAGVVLNQWTNPISQGFWIRDKGKRFYYVTRKYAKHQVEDICPPHGESRVLALVMKLPLDRAFSDRIDNVKSLTSVLVSVHFDEDEEDSDTLHATVEDVAFIVPLNPDEKYPLVAAICRECDTGLASFIASPNDEVQEPGLHWVDATDTESPRLQSSTLDTRRVQCIQDSNGCWIVNIDRKHNFFDIEELEDNQKWCLD